MTAKVIEVIYVETTRGRGIEGDTFRMVTQYWTKSGEFLFEFDPCREVL